MSNFLIESTADGSPTARIGDSETMHSFRGAFSETLYIYGSALDRFLALEPAMARSECPRVLSLGLGLGYVEILSAAHALQHGYPLRGRSFELVPELIHGFRTWLLAPQETVETTQGSPVIPLSIYDQILARTAQAFYLQSATHLDAGELALAIRQRLAAAVACGDWILDGPLTSSTDFSQSFHIIAFDAFSSKTTPELWSREFLDPFLARACSPVCVLSTYACTGHLKRALTAAGFTLEIREGYASKRDSTLAVRSGATS